MPKTVPTGPGIEVSRLPISQIIESNGFVFLAGQVGDIPGVDGPVKGGFAAEAGAMLDNVGRLLAAVGLGYRDVVRATVYLVDMDDFPMMNEVWKRYFPSEPPTRTTVGVARLVVDYRIEIEVIAAR